MTAGCHWLADPLGRNTRTADGGFFANIALGRTGRRTNSPSQFGHFPPSMLSAHVTQKVHSNEQMRASGESGGKSRSQHSHPGRSSSIAVPRC